VFRLTNGDPLLNGGFLRKDTDEHPDLVTNLSATQSHLDFLEHGWLRALDALEVPVAILEEAGAPSVPTATIIPLASTSKLSVVSEATVPPTAKQSRKSRIPKHVVLGVTPMPDPERWLKKKERTRVEGRGGKKAKRKEGMGTGMTQGSTAPERSLTPAVTPTANRKGKKGK